MKNEDLAWKQLRAHGAAQITPGFAERVLLESTETGSPLLVTHYIMCAATAGICLAAVALYQAGVSTSDDGKNLAGWSEIAAQAQELEQGL